MTGQIAASSILKCISITNTSFGKKVIGFECDTTKDQQWTEHCIVVYTLTKFFTAQKRGACTAVTVNFAMNSSVFVAFFFFKKKAMRNPSSSRIANSTSHAACMGNGPTILLRNQANVFSPKHYILFSCRGTRNNFFSLGTTQKSYRKPIF